MLSTVDERESVVVHRVQHELHADEAEDERDAVLEVVQSVEQAAEQEVQLTQTHESEDVRGEHDERAGRDSEDGRNRVEREDEVGNGNRDEHDEHRCPHAFAVVGGAQFGAVVVGRHGDALANRCDELVFGRFFVFFGADDLVNRGVDKECAEDPEDPAELGDECRTNRDEDAAQHERDDDSHHEHFLLVLAGNREARHQNDEHEEVVEAQAVFGEPSGVELGGVLHVAEGENREAEQNRKPRVDRHPNRALAHRRNVWPLEDDQDVRHENQHEGDKRTYLKPCGKLSVEHAESLRGIN